VNPFEFVLAIIIISFVFQLIKTRMSQKDRGASQRENEEYQIKISDLERRIRVLERIVTDDQENLKRQFRDLERE
jgi:flagellar capping protein FliD